MLADLNWRPLYAVSACFIKYLEVQLVNICLPYDLISVQGPVTTLRSDPYPLQLALTNTLFMQDQSPCGTHCQLPLLVLHRTQNSSAECVY